MKKELIDDIEEAIGFESTKELSGDWTDEYREGYIDRVKRVLELSNK